MVKLRFALCAVLVAHALWAAGTALAQGPEVSGGQPILGAQPSPPVKPVKLIFIHHSTGENWLADDNGRLGITLRNKNYFVSDTNYGWGADGIGSNTDIGHWWTWFRGPNRDTYMADLYAESNQNSSYSRLGDDPGGENQIIMFKSCFPNSALGGQPNDPPTSGSNPLRGQDAGSEHMTVANAKGIYNDILAYFATTPDKLFIVITAPPLVQNATDEAQAANARAFNNWLVDDWLDGYPGKNVVVFDFYTVLTSNGGDTDTNDVGWAVGNHHRWRSGSIQHTQTLATNYSAYGSDEWDSHPTPAGGQKASVEFAPLLNSYWERWAVSRGMPAPGAVVPSNGSAQIAVTTQFTTTWRDANGCADLVWCYFLVGASTAPSGTVYLAYNAPANKLYLRSNGGGGWVGGYAPGSANTIQNLRAKLDCSNTTVTKVGNAITVRWAIRFRTGFTGTMNLYSKVIDLGGNSLGWRKKGTVDIVP